MLIQGKRRMPHRHGRGERGGPIMTATDFLSALGGLEQRVSRIPGMSAQRLQAAIVEWKSQDQAGSESALAAVRRQFRLVELTHRVCRAECESTQVCASHRPARA